MLRRRADGSGGPEEEVREPTPSFAVSRVDRLFNAYAFLNDGFNPIYAVGADGQRFLMLDILSAAAQGAANGLVMVQNFAAELTRRLPP